jgi:hypothetical protein
MPSRSRLITIERRCAAGVRDRTLCRKSARLACDTFNGLPALATSECLVGELRAISWNRPYR